MANVIKIKNSGIVDSAPVSLEYGEIAINYADGLLFYKDSSNTIISFDLTASAGNLASDIADIEATIAMQTF